MTRRYPYRPKTTTFVMCALFFAVCALVLFWQALTNQRGLVLEGFIHFGPHGARVFYGVLCGFSLAFVVLAIAALVAYAGETNEVVVDDDGITTPGPAWRLRATRTVRFADVTAVREQSMNGQQFITLVAPTGKVSIGRSFLPTGAYDEITAYVRARLRR